MSLDEIVDEFLVAHYRALSNDPSNSNISYYSYFENTPYTRHFNPGEILEYAKDQNLITVEKWAGYVHFTENGKAIFSSGGWLQHLEKLRIEKHALELEDRENARMSAMGSHRSGLFAVRAFWLSVASIIVSIANSIWPGFLMKLLKGFQS